MYRVQSTFRRQSFETEQPNANQSNVTAIKCNCNHIKFICIRCRIRHIRHSYAKSYLKKSNDWDRIVSIRQQLLSSLLWQTYSESRFLINDHWKFWKFHHWNLKINFHKIVNYNSWNLLHAKFLNRFFMQNKQQTNWLFL